MKSFQPISRQYEINVFGEARVAVRHQGDRADDHVVNAVPLKVCGQLRERVVETPLSHEIAKALRVHLVDGMSFNCWGLSLHRRAALQILLDLLDDLANLEGAALDLREGDGVNEVLRADHRRELAEVHLRHDDVLEASQDFAEVRRERVEVSQVCAGDRLSFGPQLLDRGSYRAVGRTPAEH